MRLNSATSKNGLRLTESISASSLFIEEGNHAFNLTVKLNMNIHKQEHRTILGELNADDKVISVAISKEFNCPNIVTSHCKRDENPKYVCPPIVGKKEDPINNGVAFTFMFDAYALTIFAYPDGTSYVKKA